MPKNTEMLAEWVSHREQAKAHYAAADLLLAGLLAKIEVGTKIKNPETGEEFVLVDNFAAKNVVFKPCGVTRYDLKPIKGTKAA